MIKDIYVNSGWFDKSTSNIILKHNIGSEIPINMDSLNNRREFTWYVDSDGTQYYDDPSIPDDPINEDPDPVIPEQTIYNITTTNTNNGSITVNKTSVVKGGSVIITVTPNSGYELLKLIVNGTDVTGGVYNGLYTYNNVLSNITISATFKEVYVEPEPQDPTEPDDPLEPDPTNPDNPDTPTLTEYTVTVNVTGSGYATKSPNKESYSPGESILVQFLGGSTDYHGVVSSLKVNGTEIDINRYIEEQDAYSVYYNILDILQDVLIDVVFLRPVYNTIYFSHDDDTTFNITYWSGDTKLSTYSGIQGDSWTVQQNRPFYVGAYSKNGKVIDKITVGNHDIYPNTPYDTSIGYSDIATGDLYISVSSADLPNDPYDEHGNQWTPLNKLPQNITKILACTNMKQDRFLGNYYIFGTSVGSNKQFYLDDLHEEYWYNDGSYLHKLISDSTETGILFFDNGAIVSGKIINLKYPTNITEQLFSYIKYYGM